MLIFLNKKNLKRFLKYIMRIDKNKLLKEIEEWNDVFNRNDFKIKLIAVGGTALTLLNLKASTKDVDFTLPQNIDINKFENLLKKLGVNNIGGRRFKSKSGFIFDIYYNECIFTTVLPDDVLEKSKLIKELTNIRLYALGLNDVILSKLARNSVDDEQDIKTIFEKTKIDLHEFKKRYKEIHELNLDKNIGYHFKRLISVLLKEWDLK